MNSGRVSKLFGGVYVENFARPIEPELAADIVSKGREGYPIYLIAEVVGVSKRKVSAVLAANDIAVNQHMKRSNSGG